MRSRPGWLLLALLAACHEPSPPAPSASSTNPAHGASAAAKASATVRAATTGASTVVGAAATAATAALDLDLIEFTTAGADAAQALPLVLALHGLGDRPENFGTWLRELPVAARVYALRAPQAWGQGFSWFQPTSRSGPADPDTLGPRAEEATGRILANLDRLLARRPTRGKPVVVGFSQGGMLAFALAARSPERFAGVFPVSGVLATSIEPAAAPASAPRLLAFHGVDDARVPIALGRLSVERFRAQGWTAELREYSGLGHSISPDERRALLDAIASALPAR